MPAGEYWDYQLIQNYIYPRATYGEEPYASKLEGRSRRADPHVPAATRSTSWSSAARPTATGAFSAPATARRSRWTTGGSARCVVGVAAAPPGRNTAALRDSSRKLSTSPSKPTACSRAAPPRRGRRRRRRSTSHARGPAARVGPRPSGASTPSASVRSARVVGVHLRQVAERPQVRMVDQVPA